MNKLIAVIRREFMASAANKTFIILTIIGPFLILAITILPGLLAASPDLVSGNSAVSICGADAQLESVFTQAFENQGRSLIKVAQSDKAAAKASVLSDETAAFIDFGPNWEDSGPSIFTKTGTDYALYSLVESIVDQYARERRIADSGLDPALIATLTRRISVSVIKINADSSETESGESEYLTTLFVAMSFVMLIYMTVILYGQLIGRSVVQEKTGKTVEIMLSSLSPRQLLFGKIIGLGLAGILQYAVWISMALILTSLVGPRFNITVPPALSVTNLLWLVILFIMAFFLYASGYAAIGAAAEDDHQLQQLAWPLIIFLILPMLLISNLIMAPSSPIAVIFSFFPFTSPVVLLIRLLVAPPPIWQIAISIFILAASIVVLAAGAAKIFRIGILLTGKRASFKEMLKWLKNP